MLQQKIFTGARLVPGEHLPVRRYELFHEREKDRAGFADFEFVRAIGLLGALAQCTIEEPAEMTALKFPCGAMFSLGALFFLPARNTIGISPALVDEEKEELAFNVGGNGSPSLFIAVNRFE
jgi:hypothetical protein